MYGYDEFGRDLYAEHTGESRNETQGGSRDGTQTGIPYTKQGSLQPYGYTGYRYSSISNSYHAVSREYDPNTGRFQTKDEDSYIDFDDPQSLNQYVYCYSNPLRYIDPLGHAAATINRKLTATGIKELVTGKVQSLYEGVVSGKLMNDLSMDFNQRLKTIKGAGKEVLEEGRITLLKLTGAGGKAIKAAIEKGSLKAETYRVEMEKRYGEVKVAPPVIRIISEKQILENEQKWRESVEKIAMDHKGEWVKGYYISKEGVLYEGTLLGMEQVERERRLEKGGSEEIGAPAITTDWLRLYDQPTASSEKQYSVKRHPDAAKFDWGMEEELYRKNVAKQPIKRGELTNNSKQVIENAGGTPVVNITKNNLYTDAGGRYWVAVGPNVMNPQHKTNEKVTLEEMKYGTKIDIRVKDKDGNDYYIPAVVGDVKAHTSPAGLYQTGDGFPGEKDDLTHNDHSTVEFMGYQISEIEVDGKSKSSVNITNDYELVEIIVYEDVYNY